MAITADTNALWWNPILPLQAVIPVCVLALILLIAMMCLRRQSLQTVLFGALRMALALALVVVIIARPMHAGDQADLETRNLDVLFVVDTTISMWAQDYDGGKERMEGVRADCAHIMEELAGANFGLIRFDNRAQILAPFTQDARNVTDAFDTIRSPDRDYALGSDLSAPYAQMQELLLSSDKKEDRRTIVFFLSDGEITNGAMLNSYAPLSVYIDGGAVMGYGTADGGRMREGGYNSYVYDPQTDAAAVSKIDEGNLKQIAEDLGVTYLYMDTSSRVDATLAHARQIARTTVSEAKITTFDDAYYFFVAPLIVLLLIMLCRQMFVRKV